MIRYTVTDIICLPIVDNSTLIYVRNPDFSVLAKGYYFQKYIASCSDLLVESFTFDDHNTLYIDIKEDSADGKEA